MDFRRFLKRNSKVAAVFAVLLVSAILLLLVPQAEMAARATDAPQVYYQTRILASGIWDDAGVSARPQELMLRLYANGEEVAAKAITGSSTAWDFDFGEYETYHLGIPVQYTLLSDPVQSYTMQIAPGTEEAGALRFEIKGTHSNVVLSRRIFASTATGDEKHMVFFGIICLLSILLLSVYFVMRNRRK